MANKEKRILFSSEEIDKRNIELGEEISKDYEGKKLVAISLLRGSFIFASDLVRNISIPVEIDFLTTSSYGDQEETSGNVEIVTDIRSDIEGRDVLIIDDIMDSGYTMQYVIEHLKKKNPSSIKTAVMLDKPSRRKVDLKPDYIGFSIPDVFIVGYGLNYGDYYRNIPYIFTFD
ncbi:hypoxanthine phosphoribosyltransferase [Anaerosalibacter bizertensis]|uniref:Hypoxanthine phosphoribosyltransferase n=1 Tax=Anaerosalibacter bizertensis TaxID=932217 RepID=A0A844FI84_9FIRM|nr:hypoxanthine phosphoribosyltransferase [Anaerosalibacter bizertensis]MBV1819034.1 hypoxanthine phosphoribosyltransferase [Bacteroidales bacterium MSK.15.36]HHV25625.1 hypoxanthine phosphoribosyltransferase [Tissierellia bacterium]MCB5560008.1 hypoxanthine phosphoribosyltransferase [Anaerosalibacter bizertensis]MCG4565751.1 hypoxanthine phosphoribosyltransferase [Anaerosalibacter bizertensis]MCG4583596.1 hypoxanthine phosphoribosyltransferase [Anaerosalibacter bizertensis]